MLYVSFFILFLKCSLYRHGTFYGLFSLFGSSSQELIGSVSVPDPCLERCVFVE